MPIRDAVETEPPTKETAEPSLILNDDFAPRAQKSEAPRDENTGKSSAEAGGKDSVVKGLNNDFAIVDNAAKPFDKNSAVDIAVKSLNEYSADGPPAPPPDPDSPQDINSVLSKIRAAEGQKGVDEFEKAVNAKLRYGLEFKAIGDGGAYRIGPTKERLDMIKNVQESLSERQIKSPGITPAGWQKIGKAIDTIAKNGGAEAVDEFLNQVNSKVWTGFELQRDGKGFGVGPNQEKIDAMKQVAEVAAKEARGEKPTAREKFKSEQTLMELAMSPSEQVKNFNKFVNSQMSGNTTFEATTNGTYFLFKK